MNFKGENVNMGIAVDYVILMRWRYFFISNNLVYEWRRKGKTLKLLYE